MMRFQLYLLLIIYSIIGCTYQVQEFHPYSRLELTVCHENSHWTVEKITQDLVGEWIVLYSGCPWIGYTELEKKIIVSLAADSTVTVIEDGIETFSSKWFIAESTDSMFQLNTTEYVGYIEGTIILCGNEILVADMRTSDYCEFFWKRKD